MKTEHPSQFARAVALDEAIRNHGSTDGPTFLHCSLVPLAEVDFIDERQGMFDWMCDSGHCGV